MEKKRYFPISLQHKETKSHGTLMEKWQLLYSTSKVVNIMHFCFQNTFLFAVMCITTRYTTTDFSIPYIFFTDSLFFQPNRTKKCGKFVFIHFHLYIFTGVLCDTRIVWMYLLNKINLISIIPISICSIFSNSLRILLDFLILFLLPFSVLAFAFVERFYLFHWLCILSVFFSYFLHSLI